MKQRRTSLSSCRLPVNVVIDRRRLNHNSNLEDSDMVHLTILHREHPCLSTSTQPVDPSPSALSRYHAHVRRLTGSISSCPADQVNNSGPIIANGVPWDYFSYVTQIQLGTPGRTHSVLIDTGSSFPWIMCKSCKEGCDKQADPLFDPAASSTYKQIRCGSSLCTIIPEATMTRNTCFWYFQSCTYNNKYEDNSTSKGIASFDRLMYAKGNMMEAFLFGCTTSFSGIGGQYSGIIGLSANSLSFFSQVSIGRYKAMSFCLPHPQKTGYLKFGLYEEMDGMQFSPMFKDGNNYYTHITNIMVGNDTLYFPLGLGENNTMRCFIDTGTPYTMLPDQLFQNLSNAVENNIKGFYRLHAWAGQTCFQREILWNEEDTDIPAIMIMFEGNATIKLVAEDLWFREDSGLLCLAFKKGAGGDVVLGSRHMMTTHIVIDLEKSAMGLLDHGCA
ncbi:unnamed protein product [Urochloa decumbens]|uniref:Peptidase A1 domain-containing protein n=1 Tax=Urochloa decumbens TaxID=240449 RepID=A0ABC8YUV3_9POAL